MKRISRLFIYFIILLLLLITFTDSDTLNSLFVHYDDIVVKEVAIVDTNNNQAVSSASITQLENTAESASVPSTPVVNNIASTDYWAWPTDNNYVITTYYSSSHKALDIYNYNGHGSNIYAANNGTVSMVMGGCVVGDLRCNGAGGNYVVINHNNGYYTVYMHLSRIFVNVGDTVARGQVIGTMGNTGNVIPVPTASAPYNGTHLHFCLYNGEPYKGGYAINPMSLY